MRRKTKIIATLGPACASQDGISRMVGAGMDVARLNFSHGTYDGHRQFIEWVRNAAVEHGRAIAVLQDIQGPRIRVGTFPGSSVSLENGARVRLVDGNGEGTAELVYVQHLAAASLVPGDQVLLSDGMLDLVVVESDGESVVAEVVEGGVLSNNKGAAFPGASLSLPAITSKDIEDLEFGKTVGVDLVAASFVTSGADIDLVKEIVGDVPVIAKIERVSAYANLDEIVSVADGAMVARGDLGVELGFEPLPRAQKEIIARTNGSGGISITATEMLESMTSSPRPSRAEVTDVANAVLDGTDAVMLSAETAAGQYPIRAIEVMAAICVEAEASPGYPAGGHIDFVDVKANFASAIAQATADVANSLSLSTVVAFTESGKTAQLVAKYRPDSEIVAFTPKTSTYNQMSIVWGVTPLMFPRLDSTDEMIERAEEALVEHGIAEAGEWVAMAAGIPPNKAASTNLLKLHVVGSGSEGVPTA